MAESLCPVCGKAFRRLDRHLARHAGTGTTAAALRALQQSPPVPGRRAEHRCEELKPAGDCLMTLDLGADPRFIRDAEAAGRTVELEGGLDAAYGSSERALAAWEHHRGELATYARAAQAQAAQGGYTEPANPPLAAKVFQPGLPWPPPLGREVRHG
jgi:hypothetical protein